MEGVEATQEVRRVDKSSASDSAILKSSARNTIVANYRIVAA